MVISSKW